MAITSKPTLFRSITVAGFMGDPDYESLQLAPEILTDVATHIGRYGFSLHPLAAGEPVAGGATLQVISVHQVGNRTLIRGSYPDGVTPAGRLVLADNGFGMRLGLRVTDITGAADTLEIWSSLHST